MRESRVMALRTCAHVWQQALLMLPARSGFQLVLLPRTTVSCRTCSGGHQGISEVTASVFKQELFNLLKRGMNGSPPKQSLGSSLTRITRTNLSWKCGVSTSLSAPWASKQFFPDNTNRQSHPSLL